jgi:preprotein translocase subunit SecD
MNHYALWKNLLIVAVLAIAGLFALPNIFGEDPALQISYDNGGNLDEAALVSVERVLQLQGIQSEQPYLSAGRGLVHFANVEQQLAAAETLRSGLGKGFVVALTLAPRTPGWLRDLGLQPMSLGLDLRGGVHFLFEVDMDSAITQRLSIYQEEFDQLLRKERIRRNVRIVGDAIEVKVGNPNDLGRSEELIREADDQLDIKTVERNGEEVLLIAMTPEQIRDRQNFAIQKNTVTLRNRVNELGVAEPVVQRQGTDRIVVQLPGVQDPTQAERVLGATATLEFRMVCENEDPYAAERRGRAPLGCELFSERNGAPVLLKRTTIVTGDQLVDASSGFSEGSPVVLVKLDSKGANRMLETTKNNLNKPMAVVFVEQKRSFVELNGETKEVSRVEREVINIANIRGVFSSSFQISGLDVGEARDLSLLLRAGALSAPIYKVEERTIGPSLGQDNIDAGVSAIVIGFLFVVVFMAVYYRVFGLVANVALFSNLILITALLSALQAALTLPGLAGIVLTVGMAVDANVLIFERIKEELRNGVSPQAAISSGYDKALSTIADANITTLIAAVMLFVFGTGPIKGFAITLSLGILSSMFTAIIVTRALVNLIYGSRNVKRLSIGGGDLSGTAVQTGAKS